MWHAIFDPGTSIAEKVLRTVLIYAFLVVALRLAGKRELGQLNVLDFVVLLAVANAVQNGLIGADNSVTGAAVGAAVLFGVNTALLFVLFRRPRLRRLVEGAPTVLIQDGQLDRRALDREELDLEDLQTAVQQSGADSFAQVHVAKMQPDGQLVVIPRKDDEATIQYHDLVRRLEELTALVRAQRPAQ